MNYYTNRYKYRITPQTSEKSNNVRLGVIILGISLIVNYIVAQDWYQQLMVLLSNM